MSAFETLIYEKEDALALVTLNRPQFLNAYNIQMRDDLFEVLNAIRDDDEVRVVLFKGAGEKAFCAGADLSEFLTAPPPVAARQIRFDRDVWGLFLSIAPAIDCGSSRLCIGFRNRNGVGLRPENYFR